MFDPRIIRALKWAEKIASSSNDAYMKVGVVFLNDHLEVCITGYNKCLTPHIVDRDYRRPFCVHAEIDACSKISRDEYKIAVITLLPCCHCMHLLGSLGFKTVYYDDIYEKDIHALGVATLWHMRAIQIPDGNGSLKKPH